MGRYKEEIKTEEPQLGCRFCYDFKKKRNIPLFFIDRANNMRPCEWCPSCGRPLQE